MAYRNIRDFLAKLEEAGRLRRIAVPVDHTWELACLARWMLQGLPEEQRFGLLFERVTGFDTKVMTAVLGASRWNYALALETTPDGIHEKWVNALLHPIAPRAVEVSPAREVVAAGADVDLKAIPIPTWTPGKDAAPYITATVITVDLDTGVQNAATYRCMVKDRNHLAINLTPGRHGHLNYSTWAGRGRPAPFAIVVGAEPVVHLAAIANVPYGTDELTIAGGLKGAPVEVVRGRTGDLLIPAHCEFIIEGEIPPNATTLEGNFGEFAGYMGGVNEKPLATITSISRRRDAIYYGYISQMPPSESTMIQSKSNEGLILKMLRHDHGETTVKDVAIDLTYGGLLAHCVVSMTPRDPEHARRVGRLVAESTALKRVTVVDEDVDIRDPFHMDWALNSRYNPVRDTIIIDNVTTGIIMDPSIRWMDGKPIEAGSKVVIDATEKTGAGEISLPPRDLMLKAKETWDGLGLPAFEIPKRVRLVLDRAAQRPRRDA
jgi:UbiD family decarboxylase